MQYVGKLWTVLLSPSLLPKSIDLTFGHHRVAGIILAIKLLELALELAFRPQAVEGWIYIYNLEKGKRSAVLNMFAKGWKVLSH